MTNLRLESVLISSLSLDPTNARRHDSKNLASIEGSLRLFGQRKPIVVTGANVVVAGNGTLEAAKSLGWSEIDVVRVPNDWTAEQVKAYALADNRTAELAEWDAKVLADQLVELDAVGWDVSEFGFEPMNPTGDLNDDEPLSFDENKPTRSKLGDLWQVGEHRILCGDSQDKSAVARLLDSKKIDCILTDPPYGINLNTDYSSYGEKGKTYSPILNDDKPFDYSIFEYLKCEEQFWFGGNYYCKTLPDFGSWSIWDKYPTDNNDKRFGNLFEVIWSKKKHKQVLFRTPSLNIGHFKVEDIVHPTQKPTKLMIEILNKWTEPKNLILDLFAGSGSTLLACARTNRVGYGIELDPQYVDVILDRLEKETGLEASRLEQ